MQTMLIAEELQACIDFHRLAKHPRSDAGTYIRSLLDQYAVDLGLSRLPPFITRYAWANDRYRERWFVGESSTTEHITKTTRRLNLRLPYSHQHWRLRTISLPFQTWLARRHAQLLTPWLCWCEDVYTNALMGFRVTPAPPTACDVQLTVRWSIWHFDAPWWKARGVPDILDVPAALDLSADDTRRALAYTRTTVNSIEQCNEDLQMWPESVITWLNSQVQHQMVGQRPRWTIADVRTQLLDLVHDSMKDSVFARATPTMLIEQGVSLPWGTGIAAALLLPSAGIHQIHQGLVSPWGIPFDLSSSGLLEGTKVDVRFDPDDAQLLYCIYDRARVIQAQACAFEHRTTWLELVKNPAILT